MAEPAWTIEVAASAGRQLDRLPEKLAAAVVEFLFGPLIKNPRRVGHPLHRELADLHAARRGAYRIVYEIDEDRRVVSVLRIDHRADVYRPW